MQNSNSDQNLKEALGGATEIRNNSTAWDIRTANLPELDPITQPILYAIQQKIDAKKQK